MIRDSILADGVAKMSFGDIYKPLQFHFHAPSEHTLDGDRYALEMHIVTQRADGALAVLGVWADPEACNTTEKNLNAFLEVVIKAAPHAPRGGDPVPCYKYIPQSTFLHKAIPYADYSNYPGSLTTPNCAEIVNWVMFDEVMCVSDDLVKDFMKIVTAEEAFEDLNHKLIYNARPVQDLNGRKIKQGYASSP